ncbi:L-aspartate oxidase [BD1-7 clade bacterium]|uniref:L-aspartate oxidase n=1 Tax=BD1-7 clade bacterium TaxID=2029982 RepID=A0A5S9P9K1_9GAMM|nr:L-aspartate oxidase [BD1-7 clade bacterium]
MRHYTPLSACIETLLWFAMNRHYHYDALIIGSGASGLCLALSLAQNFKVAIISKNAAREGSTYYAQGGIAAVLDDKDSIDLHVKDTMNAGAGICREDAVRFTVEHSKAAIEWLVEQGVEFDRRTDNHLEDFHLTKEGGHSHRRIIHAADATGRAVSTVLIEQASRNPNITFFEDHIAIDLIKQSNRCVGAYIMDQQRQRIDCFHAKFTVLACGGASKVYLYSSNPEGNSGDGIAMAWRAGCRVANMEFNQFHPTCLYHPKAKSFLITEAVRGEGGLLKLPNGERFMQNVDDRAELAPRDIVARAIDHEMKRQGLDCVYLDISHKPAAFIRQHFPTVAKRCLELGIDITKEPIPVVPAAHYTCGGIVIDDAGRTDLPGLLAIGETAFTGLHGANRMASNSLLECLVYARSAADHIRETIDDVDDINHSPGWDESRVTESQEDVTISHSWHELRQVMWDYVGIVRSEKRLKRALNRISLIKQEVQDYYRNYRISGDLVELRNLVLVAEIIVHSAINRKESRGLHYNLDYPDMLPDSGDTILCPPDFHSESSIGSIDGKTP